MKLFTATKYRLVSYLRLVGGFTLFWLLFSLVLPLLFAIGSSQLPMTHLGNPLFITFFFSALATSLVTSKGLKFLFQNGVSRNSMFFSAGLTLIFGSVLLLILSKLLILLLGSLPFIEVKDDLWQFYGHYFHSVVANHGSVWLLEYLLMIGISALFLLFGTIMSLLSKFQKGLFWVLLVFLPILFSMSSQHTGANTMQGFIDFVLWSVGYNGSNVAATPLHLIVVLLPVVLICLIGEFFVIKKIQLPMIKEK